jgi:hypothetical protein
MSKAQLEARQKDGEKIRGGELTESDVKMSETLARALMLSSKWLIFRPPTDCQLHSHDYVLIGKT